MALNPFKDTSRLVPLPQLNPGVVPFLHLGGHLPETAFHLSSEPWN